MQYRKFMISIYIYIYIYIYILIYLNKCLFKNSTILINTLEMQISN